MESYRACGLTLLSEIELPELPRGHGAPDVRIVRGRVDPEGAVSIDPTCRLRTAANDALLAWEGVGAFAIRRGREITVAAAPCVDAALLRRFILGSCIAVLLHQRGRVILHASASAVEDLAAVFLGHRGSGKSTVGSALHSAGHAMIGDDLVSLDLRSSSEPWVFPTYPVMRLWPDALAALGEDPESLPRIDPGFEKRSRLVAERFQQRPLPLRCIYVLSRGEGLEIQPAAPQSGFMELVWNSYLARIIRELGAREHFLQCAELVRRVPVRRILRDTGRVRPAEVAKAVEEDLRRLQC
jgi:hypothetical protein